MKKVLLSFVLLATVGFLNVLHAQCSISQSSVIVNIRSVNSGPSGCAVTFDLTFDLANNGGNKWSYIHIWDANAYPTVNYSSAPKLSALTANGTKPLLATVALYYFNGVISVGTSYAPDNSVPVLSSDITFSMTSVSAGTRFTVKNITVNSTNCSPINLKADVWSAQDNNGKNLACYATGVTAQVDEPQIFGSLNCTSSPMTFGVNIQTTQARDVTFTAYKDVAPLGVFDDNDLANVVHGPETISSPGDGQFHPYGLYTSLLPGKDYNIWVIAQADGINNKNGYLITNNCATLPVNFSSFNAARKNQTSVALTWETSFEQNNKGFYVQRNTNGEWKNVAFVFSSADGGNSSQTLRYAYNDPNNLNSISYYRIQQVDIDGRARYSDVRAVRGEEQASKIMLFPNPGTGGKVNVMFNDEAAAKDVMVYDATGRVVKSFKSVSGNSLSINGLKPGMYSLQVTNVASATTSSEKFIIQN